MQNTRKNKGVKEREKSKQISMNKGCLSHTSHLPSFSTNEELARYKYKHAYTHNKKRVQIKLRSLHFHITSHISACYQHGCTLCIFSILYLSYFPPFLCLLPPTFRVFVVVHTAVCYNFTLRTHSYIHMQRCTCVYMYTRKRGKRENG
mmetsp:Transcript_35568/g.92732  ORF Transcript_35568/g.92732 Transcript_35568/m.92732 type:complete len:148 (-) Transcript_35568:1149-1592(-)